MHSNLSTWAAVVLLAFGADGSGRPAEGSGGVISPSTRARDLQESDVRSAQLLETITRRFQAWNGRLERVEILEEATVKSSTLEDSLSVVLAHAIRADRNYADSFEDEAFGVFVVEAAGSDVRESLGYVPTCRWLDCEVWIDGAWTDSVRIEWRGATYGDQAGDRTFHRWGLEDWLIDPAQRVGPVQRAATARELVARLGSDAVSHEPVPIAEGFCSPGAVLFGDSPNRLEILWRDARAADPAVVRVSGRGGDWHTADGVYPGITLRELQMKRGSPIGFSGFGWDYGGGTSWGEPGQSIGLSLAYDRAQAEALTEHPRLREIYGDRQVRSDHPVIQALRVWVAEINVTWANTEVEEPCVP